MQVPIWMRLLRIYGSRFPIARGKGRVTKWAFRKLPSLNHHIIGKIGRDISCELRPWLWSDYCTYILGSTEPYLLAYFRSLLKSEMIVFDVGAYIGVYALTACEIVDKGSIHVFEPNPASAKRIQETIQKNHLPNVHINQCAVGSHTGMARLGLYHPPTSSALSRSDLTSAACDVSINSLDAYCTEMDIDRLDIIKIDVEGAEYDVLLGAADVIQHLRPQMFVEVHRKLATRYGHPAEKTIELLRNLDYSLFQVTHGLTTRPRLTPLEEEGWSRRIVIACPEKR